MQQRLPKFKRAPEKVHNKQITDLSLRILETVLRYPFASTSLLVRLVESNQDVINRHLQQLWHRGFVSRFAFPRPGNPGQFHYYIASPNIPRLLLERGFDIEPALFEQVRRNKDRAYEEIQDREKAPEAVGRMLFLMHEAMITRFHAALELACRASAGRAELHSWKQGSELWTSVQAPKLVRAPNGEWEQGNDLEHLPIRPDALFTLRFPLEPADKNKASFFYEADRKTTTNTIRFSRKLRAYFHLIVKKRIHEEFYGIRRVRAVLTETTDTLWAETLRQAAAHPIVSGQHPSPLFWFTASTVFAREDATNVQGRQKKTPRFLLNPEILLKRIWVSAASTDTPNSLLD